LTQTITVNYSLIESLFEFYRYYGNEFRIEHPTGSGNRFSLSEIADNLARRVITLFHKDAQVVRPLLAAYPTAASGRAFTGPHPVSRVFYGDSGRNVLSETPSLTDALRH
jgi:hypothetical protein